MSDAPLEQLITDLQRDGPGTLAHTLDLALAFARDHLHDAKEGAGSGALDGALDQLTHAIEALQLYRTRLEELAVDPESIERDLALLRSNDAVLGEDGEIGLSNT